MNTKNQDLQENRVEISRIVKSVCVCAIALLSLWETASDIESKDIFGKQGHFVPSSPFQRAV